MTSMIISVELDPDVAYQLAQFCKRSTFNMFLDSTEAHLTYEDRRTRAYQMIAGIEAIAAGLSRSGVSPR